MRSGHIIRCVSGARDVRGIGVWKETCYWGNEPLTNISEPKYLAMFPKKDIV
jgi:hypothetical protein